MDEPSIEQRLQALEVLHRNFQIVGGSNITVEGSLRHGFALCSTCPQVAAAEEGGGGGTIVIPPTTPMGACCLDGECSIDTETHCESGGGTYQGDFTTCGEVDCGETTFGACCVGTTCSIETPSGCAGIGGTYQGDGTPCDPNPCGATGTCCTDGVCSITTEDACSGNYLGDDTTCDGVDCTVGTCCGEGGVCSVTTIELCDGVFLGGRNCDNPCFCLVASAGYEFCGTDILGNPSCCPAGQLCCTCSGGLPPAVCCDPANFICGDCGLGGATCQPI